MQDSAIIEIGKVKGAKAEKPYQSFIQNLFPGKNYDMVLAIFNYEKTGKGYEIKFDNIDSQKVSERNANFMKFAYRKGSSRGGDITFTTKFNNVEKLFSTIQNQLKKLIVFCQKEELLDDAHFFQTLKNILDEDTDTIEKELLDKWGDSLGNPTIPLGFSFVFKYGNNYKYLEDFKSIQQLLYQVGTAGKSTKYKVTSEGYDELCSICLNKQPILHGFASPFKYSTVDKTGLVSGFFKQKNNWKNYPICSDCALDFELGQKYVVQNLSKSFYGKNYYIIPKVAVGSNPKLLKRALNILEDLEYREKEGEKIATRENHLLRKIGREAGDHNQFSLTLLFFEENLTTKAIKIKLLLEQIFPSRFQTVFVKVPKIINANLIYKNALTIKKQPQDLKFFFQILKDFFDKDFYQIIQTVFIGTPISLELLFTKFIRLIQSNYNKSKTSDGFVEPTKWTVLKAMMTLAYLKELNIIPKNKPSKIMEIPNQSDANDKKGAFDDLAFRNFIEDNKDFFDLDNGHKAGIFAVGVLVRQVFNWQSAKLDGNTPFEKKLKGYHLNSDNLKNIYLEALDKLNNYTNFHTYQGLRSFINEYFILNSHKLKQISNNELSFYFVAGLEFGNQFKTQKSKDNG